MTELSQGLVDYHQRSKHRVNHYAPGPTGLDWASQPDPFLIFATPSRVGCERPAFLPKIEKHCSAMPIIRWPVTMRVPMWVTY
jgi:hypothetical protein